MITAVSSGMSFGEPLLFSTGVHRIPGVAMANPQRLLAPLLRAQTIQPITTD